MNVNEMRERVDQAVSLLKALASRNRLMVLCQLVEGERSVGELAELLELRQTVVSQHLALLRRDGLVTTRRDGQTIYYSLEGEAASRVLQTLYDLYCTPGKEPERSRPTTAWTRSSPDPVRSGKKKP